MRLNFFGGSAKSGGEESQGASWRRSPREAGDHARDRRDWDEAERWYAQHLETNPQDFAIWVQLGNCRKELGDYTGSLDAYDRAGRLDEQDPDIHLQKGHALKLAGRASDAIAAYRRSVECRAENNPALLELAALAPMELARLPNRGARLDAGVRTLYLDVTDLIDYVKGNVTLSGIQRVAANLIARAADYSRSARAVSIMFVAPDYGKKRLLTVGSRLMNGLVEMMLAGNPERKTLDGILSAIESSKQPATIGAGDILAIPGAFWIVADFDLINVLRQRGATIVVFVHDLIQATNPEYVHHGANEAFRVSFNDMACLSDRFVTSSDFVAKEIRRYLEDKLNLDVEIVATPLATELGRPKRSSDAGDPLSFLLEEGFVLCVGTIEIRKNHAYLIRIWERLIAEGAAPVPNLVFVGKWGWDIEDLKTYIAKSDYLGFRLHIYDALPDADLAWLYENCLFTIYPSFAEGWGLPIGESLAFGKPCVASSTTSMPEVGGRFCRYVDPYDLEGGLRVISAILSDPKGLAEWTNEVRTGFKPKSWRTFADEFFDAAVTAAEKIDLGNRGANCLIETAAIAPFGGAALAEMDARKMKLVSARMSRMSGWNAAETWGCWASQRRAVLRFRTKLLPGTDCAVYLHLRSPNDHAVGECAVKSGAFTTLLQVGGTPSWRVARCRVGERGMVELALLSGRGFKPRRERGADNTSDPRELYIGVIAVAIAPANDADARRKIIDQIVPELAIPFG